VKATFATGLELEEVTSGAHIGHRHTTERRHMMGYRITLSPKNSQLPASHLVTSDDQPSLELSGFLQGEY
jgi:hypothetical protein